MTGYAVMEIPPAPEEFPRLSIPLSHEMLCPIVGHHCNK